MSGERLKLYTYFRSSAAYRVRIALNLKGVNAAQIPVHLVRDGGEQHGDAYRAINPIELVPALDTGAGVLTQSLAICEWLEETHPQPPILPPSPADRAYVRAVALTIACDIHPLDNLRVLQRLTDALGLAQDVRDEWYRHWIVEGFDRLEALIAREGRAGALCFADTPTLADICLVPQVANARRGGVDLAPYPRIAAIDAHARALPAFADAAPERQPDFPG